MTDKDKLQWLWDNGYVIMSREVWEGLNRRIATVQGGHILFDPSDDAEGYLLVGNDLPNLCDEAWAFLAT